MKNNCVTTLLLTADGVFMIKSLSLFGYNTFNLIALCREPILNFKIAKTQNREIIVQPFIQSDQCMDCLKMHM